MKMATFESYYVNFFSETDYVFQEGKGPVERADIENINISEIIENRDFKLLEKNLVHVRNFNFEKGYNVKGLDENLFKLFRLAQIGLNYLMHKESCLSKCLLLLQEEVETLQRERESSKRLLNSNVQRAKNRKTIVEPHYQCQECGKIFITESYLKCHEKRRHKNPLNLKCEEENAKRSIHTQTLLEGNVDEKESKSHHMIQKLEKELEELKNRLNATETCLKEKENEPPQCSPVPQKVFFPSTVVHSVFPARPQPDPIESPSHFLPHQNHHAKIIIDSPDKNEEKLSECFSKSGAGNDQRNDDKENTKPSSVSIPKPFPRRIKEKKETDFGARSRRGANAPTIDPPKEVKNSEKNRYDYSSGERRKEVETVEKTITKETDWGFECCEEKGASKSASLLKKLVKKSSPRILELKYNLKKSFTNLYEAVTSGGKENPKGKDDDESEAGQPGTTETANSRQVKEISDGPKKKLLTTEPESERKMEKGVERWDGGDLKDYRETRSLKENGGNSVMYSSYGCMQIESDPESDSPSFKENEIKQKTQLTMRNGEKEFDLTIFQVGKFKNNFKE